jgi:hypothetical protein
MQTGPAPIIPSMRPTHQAKPADMPITTNRERRESNLIPLDLIGMDFRAHRPTGLSVPLAFPASLEQQKFD